MVSTPVIHTMDYYSASKGMEGWVGLVIVLNHAVQGRQYFAAVGSVKDATDDGQRMCIFQHLWLV